MKIEDAKLCMNCDEIFDGNRHLDCPVCARGPNHNIRDWLNRKTSPE